MKIGAKPTPFLNLWDFASIIVGAAILCAYPRMFTGASILWLAFLASTAGLLTQKLPIFFAYVISVCFVEPIMSKIAVIFVVTQGEFPHHYLTIATSGLMLSATLVLVLERYRWQDLTIANAEARGKCSPQKLRYLSAAAKLVLLLTPVITWCVPIILGLVKNYRGLSTFFVGFPMHFIFSAYSAFTIAPMLPAIGATLVFVPLARALARTILPVQTIQLATKTGSRE